MQIAFNLHEMSNKSYFLGKKEDFFFEILPTENFTQHAKC